MKKFVQLVFNIRYFHIKINRWIESHFEKGGTDWSQKGSVGLQKVCIECIGQSAPFVCSNRTLSVRLAHTNGTDCPLQSTQHSFADPQTPFAANPGFLKRKFLKM